MKICPECTLTYPDASGFCFADGAELAACEDPYVGLTIGGRFELGGLLGRGATSAVYRARNRLTGAPCAVKLLRPSHAHDPLLTERFRRETRSCDLLTHPNIVEVLEHGELDDGAPYMVMELFEGTSLATLLMGGKLPLPRALPIAVAIGRALGRAHDFEVIHRDLKPENVFVLRGEHVKILDFGAARNLGDARLTTMGEVFGTPQYMAPERAGSLEVTPASDLYSLGVVLFELFSQRKPFTAHDTTGWLVKHAKERPPPLRSLAPECPAELEELVATLLAKNPNDRPIDAHRVTQCLEALCLREGIALPPEADLPPASEAQPLPAADPWPRRLELFQQMVARAYGPSTPADLASLLEASQGHAQELVTLATSALEEEERLAALEREARAVRSRIGRAMEAIARDASDTRDAARAERRLAGEARAAIAGFPAEVKAAHRELMAWEGRCAFVEPRQELADAYARLAELVGRWYAGRKRELAANAAAAQRDAALGEVEFQLRELRASLSREERGAAERKLPHRTKLRAVGERLTLLNAELQFAASRLTAPLRARPELAALFAELRRAAAP